MKWMIQGQPYSNINVISIRKQRVSHTSNTNRDYERKRPQKDLLDQVKDDRFLDLRVKMSTRPGRR